MKRIKMDWLINYYCKLLKKLLDYCSANYIDFYNIKNNKLNLAQFCEDNGFNLNGFEAFVNHQNVYYGQIVIDGDIELEDVVEYLAMIVAVSTHQLINQELKTNPEIIDLFEAFLHSKIEGLNIQEIIEEQIWWIKN